MACDTATCTRDWTSAATYNGSYYRLWWNYWSTTRLKYASMCTAYYYSSCAAGTRAPWYSTRWYDAMHGTDLGCAATRYAVLFYKPVPRNACYCPGMLYYMLRR
eukprot:3484695-Rhodomonas_salina.1